GSNALKLRIESNGPKLRNRILKPIGRSIRAGADDSYMRPLGVRALERIPGLKMFVLGESLRDWTPNHRDSIIYPYGTDEFLAQVQNELLPWRTTLRQRSTFQGTMADAGLGW